MRTYQGIAFRTAYLLAGNAADAEEAAQDGFVKAQRALGRFRRGAPLKPWLLRIVANEARNRRRSAGRRERLVLRAIDETRPGDAVPSPEAALLAREDQERLLAARRAPAGRPPRRDRLPLPARALRGGDRGRAGRSAAGRSSRASRAPSRACARAWRTRHELARAAPAGARPRAGVPAGARSRARPRARPAGRSRGGGSRSRRQSWRWPPPLPCPRRAPRSFASSTSGRDDRAGRDAAGGAGALERGRPRPRV